jgi:hypothetical protein
LSRVVAIDEQIIKWLERQEKRSRRMVKRPSSS